MSSNTVRFGHINQSVPANSLVSKVTALIDPAFYYLTYDALTHPGGASTSHFDIRYCNYFTNQTALTGYSPNILETTVAGLLRLTTPIDSPGPRSLVEPSLKVQLIVALKIEFSNSHHVIYRPMFASKDKLLNAAALDIFLSPFFNSWSKFICSGARNGDSCHRFIWFPTLTGIVRPVYCTVHEVCCLAGLGILLSHPPKRYFLQNRLGVKTVTSAIVIVILY